MELRFVSNNQKKINETNKILNGEGITIIPCSKNFEEIQTDDTKSIVIDKTIKAFKKIRRPLFVEHTGLYLKSFNDFPGGLTQTVFDSLTAKNFSELFGKTKNPSAIAKTVIGYTDGKEIRTFEGKSNGKISSAPKGDESFQWDCVFIPKNCSKTFAEMGEEKNKNSMRRKALQSFMAYYKTKQYNQKTRGWDLEMLIESIEERNLILFIGSGVSRTLGLPLSCDLIDYMAEELGYEANLFKLYGNDPSLAEYYINKKTQGSIQSFRSWMENECRSKITNIKDSKIFELIVKLDCGVIYTTNYDSLLEEAHKAWGKDHTVIRNIGNIREIKDGEVQIIKFHGDFEENCSIVLSESQYFERMNFENPLDIKLRNDALGKSILFLGYSLSDINLRYLLYQTEKLWNKSGYKKYRPKSFIFLSEPNPVQEALLKERNLNTIVSVKDNPEEGLKDFLEKLGKRAF